MTMNERKPLRGKYYASQVPKDITGLPQLNVGMLATIPEWTKVRIAAIEERETSSGYPYLLITYASDSYRRSVSYFRANLLEPILTLFDLSQLEYADQILLKELWIKWGPTDDGKYVDAVGYSLHEPNSDSTEAQPETGLDMDMPF